MSFLRDLRVVIGKEWTELRGSDSPWVTVSTLVAFVAIVGVFVPWQLGPVWIRAPWPILIWAWIPLFIVTTVTADSVAGERERRTLETLLATRLSDAAILWGKWLACVLWIWAAMLICFPVAILTINLTGSGELLLPGPGQTIGTLAVAFAGAGLGAAAGVLVSLRSESVRHAQQVLAIGALVFAFIPIGMLRVLPRDWMMTLFQSLAYGSPAASAWTTAGALSALSLPILVVAQARFRRGRIALK
ncbi:MAG: ABC transporter permease subunit [Gemmatimonadota bacterium]|nr:ABC transporter permease subunit [Gemmatimonadota bacterium]